MAEPGGQTEPWGRLRGWAGELQGGTEQGKGLGVLGPGSAGSQQCWVLAVPGPGRSGSWQCCSAEELCRAGGGNAGREPHGMMQCRARKRESCAADPRAQVGFG